MSTAAATFDLAALSRGVTDWLETFRQENPGRIPKVSTVYKGLRALATGWKAWRAAQSEDDFNKAFGQLVRPPSSCFVF